MMEKSKTCARCGEAFGCGAGAVTCWCRELPPIGPFSDEDCLCLSCLRAVATARVGDCLDCRHAQTLKTKGGSAVFLCGRSGKDPRYAKYPRLPTTGCAGREAK